jgi:hypothetical protein
MMDILRYKDMVIKPSLVVIYFFFILDMEKSSFLTLFNDKV